jgi:Domain of unknown function (DUF4936)
MPMNAGWVAIFVNWAVVVGVLALHSRPMRSLFIYYRVRPADRQALWLAVSEMQSGLRGEMPGLAASLSERIDEPPTATAPQAPVPLTWMETYQFNGHASDEAWLRFENVLAQRTLQLPEGIEGARHVERFVRLSAPCLPSAPATTTTSALKD